MSRDSVFHLCVELDQNCVYLADVKVRYTDFSIYVEFQDEAGTQLHVHPTGTIRLKEGRTTIQTIQLEDPLHSKANLPLAIYEIRDINQFPLANHFDIEQLLIIPKDFVQSLAALKFTFGNLQPEHQNFVVQVGIADVLSLNVIPIKSSESNEDYEKNSNQYCKLSLSHRVSEHVDEGERFIEMNRRIINPAPNGLVDSRLETRSPVSPKGIIIRPPNSLGVWEMVFTVAMRATPRLKMLFNESRYQLVDCGISKKSFNLVSRKFQVLDLTINDLVLDELPPFELILDAEL